MTVSKNTLKYILVILGFIILLAVYFLVYMDLSDKTDALNKDIVALNSRIEQLNKYKEKIPDYKASIDEDKSIINEALSKYYSVETPEDFIMFSIALENEIGPDVTALSFTEPEPIYNMTAIKDSTDYTVPAEAATLSAYKLSSTLDGTMKYEQLKKALEFIYSQQDVTKLDSLNISYDSSTGLIVGSFIIDKYYITGREIQEHQASIPFTELGKSVLIGS